MTAPSEQEWRDAIAEWLQSGEEYDPEGCRNAADDLLGCVLVPLIERLRQQARQEALTEAGEIAAGVSDAASLDGLFADGWRSGLSTARAVIGHHAAAGGVS